MLPQYSMLSTTSTTIVFGLIFLFLARQYSTLYMKQWGLCWIVYSFMFFLDFVNITGTYTGEYYIPVRLTLSLVGATLFLNGTYHFFRVGPPKKFNILTLGFLISIGLSALFHPIYQFVVIPNVMYCAFLLIWSGCMFLFYSWTQNMPEKIIASFLIVLWAIFISHLGFTLNHVSLAIFNYFAGLFIVNLLIVILLIIHFKKVRFLTLKSEKRFRLLVENSSDCMFLYDYIKQRFQYISPSIYSILGISAEELYRAPHHFFDKVIVIDDNEKKVVTLFRRPINAPAMATLCHLSDGQPAKWSEMHYLPIKGATGAISAVEGILRDVTQRIEIEENLKASESAKKELIENISHELRTPITLVQGYTESLLNGVVPEASRQSYLEMVHSKILIIGALLEDLTQISHFTSQTMNYKFYETRAFDFFNHVINQAQFQAARFDRVFKAKNEVEDGAIVILDSTRVEQIVSNMISNSIRHTPCGGTITVSCISNKTRKTSPSENLSDADLLTIPEGEIIFTVTDTGEGIHPDDLPHIFERGFQGKNSSNKPKNGKGSGLGLFISSQIIGQHSGKMGAKRNEDGNTEIFFTIPYYKPHVY